MFLLAAVSLALAPVGFAQTAAPVAPAVAVPAAPAVVVGTVAATPVPSLSGTDTVGPMVLRDETIGQVLELLQRWTGKTVLRPQALPASLYTLSLPATATRNDALLAIETLLTLNGVAVIQQGDKFLKIVPNNVAKSESPTLLSESTLSLPASGRVASKIFLLKHANGQEVVTQIQGMLNGTLGSPPVFFGRNNAILVTDSIMNLQKIETLLAQLDRPQLDVIATKMYNLKHALATDMVTKLTALLRTPAANGAAPFRLSTGTSFTADERTNRVIVMGSADQHPFFDKLIESLDATSDPNTKTDVVFLRHANATETATLLTQLITGQTKAASTANGGRTTNGTNRVTTPVAPVAAAGAAATGSQQNGADEFSTMVTVIADVRSNSIVVSGTKDDLRLLHELIDKVDVVLPQVRIEVVIAEVTLTDNDSSGITSLGMTVTNGKLTGVNGTLFGGAGGVTGVGGGSAALAPNGTLTGIVSLGTSSTPTKNDLHVLSVPAITTSHNKEGTIFVGESRPVITGTQSTAGTTGLVTSSTVSQRDIGIQLKVLPLIGKDGSVQLQVTQQVEDVLGSVTIDGNDQPVIGRRSTDSFVSAMSGEIIVLGGLQRSNDTTTKNRLGPIPFIGDLLGGSSKTKTRTELLIFLRPYVLNNSAVDNLNAISRVDATPIAEQVHKHIDKLPASPGSGAAPATAPASPLLNGLPGSTLEVGGSSK
ncbi:MAG: type II secretory pathway, component PulD [Verrucomicrobia bacterium]|nr:type II secretory pathway, component PulD [Verrucomicrobiota bacterium]